MPKFEKPMKAAVESSFSRASVAAKRGAAPKARTVGPPATLSSIEPPGGPVLGGTLTNLVGERLADFGQTWINHLKGHHVALQVSYI